MVVQEAVGPTRAGFLNLRGEAETRLNTGQGTHPHTEVDHDEIRMALRSTVFLSTIAGIGSSGDWNGLSQPEHDVFP
jgi:hypothetical protein